MNNIKSTNEKIPLRVLASGDILYLDIFQVIGNQPGPHVYIQANIHGPEIAGIGTAHLLIEQLKAARDISGKITVVPQVNPVGLNSKINGLQVGYADLNETVVGNFNRIYQQLIDNGCKDDNKERLAVHDFVQKFLLSDLAMIKKNFKKSLKEILMDKPKTRLMM